MNDGSIEFDCSYRNLIRTSNRKQRCSRFFDPKLATFKVNELKFILPSYIILLYIDKLFHYNYSSRKNRFRNILENIRSFVGSHQLKI